MYEDLVKRLRELPHLLFVQLHGHENIVYEAADAIEKLVEVIQHHDFLESLINPQWVPVTERLPNPDVYVLVCTNRDISVDKYFGLVLGKPAFLIKSTRVTHWMPLPKAPESLKED